MKSLLEAIRYARENQVSCLRACGGFQRMILEYARNVLHYEGCEISAALKPFKHNLATR